jgi:hypothetical protein
MREIHDLSFDIDRFLEEAARAKQQLDAERWREELRPRALRLFAARTATLPWSRALLKLVVRELYPDDLFTELIGNLDRVPRRRWPQVIALAVALRHSWRQDGLARIVKSLHVTRRSAEDDARQPTKHPRRRRTSPSKRATRKDRRGR